MATKSVASRGGPPVAGPPPNQTLYVRGFDDKIQKEDVRRALYCLYTTYGSVLDINIMKTVKMHGQAHIVFRDVQTAAHAMRQTDGMEFMGGTLSVQYAKGKSNFIAKIDGTYKNPAVKPAQITPEAPSELSALQASIFNRPPGQAPSLPQKPPAREESVATSTATNETRGLKRLREEEGTPEGQPSQKAVTPNPETVGLPTSGNAGSFAANLPQIEEEDESDEMEMSEEDE